MGNDRTVQPSIIEHPCPARHGEEGELFGTGIVELVASSKIAHDGIDCSGSGDDQPLAPALGEEPSAAADE